MATSVFTDIDLGSVIAGDVECRDCTLLFAAADTWVAGTILGRKSTSADTYTGVITGTGTRVPVISARAGKSMKVGAYTLVAGTLTSGAGTWTMTDPDGITATFTTAAAGDDMTFPSLGVDVAIADTGTDYVTSDSIAFTVAAGAKVVPFSPTGTNGSQDPMAVLSYEASRTSGGDLAARVVVEGPVKKERLVIDEDGDGSNVTEGILDALRSAGIVAIDTKQLGHYDNPNNP